MYRMLITFHILFFTSRISTDVSMEVDTDNKNISFVECKIYDRNMVDDKGKNFEQNTSDKTTIWMHSSGNQTEWILLLGCYNLRTLNELNFTDNKASINLTTSSLLQECITSCHKIDNGRRYFGLQDNICFCYKNNDVTVNSDCVPHNCVESESLCGITNESVVLYYRGEFVKNHQERFCGELEENNKTSNNEEKICQDDLSYLCTENKESTNSSCHKQVMWFADRRNSTNRCVSTSNGIPITPTLPKDNYSMYQIGQFTCEIFDLMNLTSIEIASSYVKAAYFIQNFTTEGNNWNTSHLLQCSKPDNLIGTTPSTGLYNDTNTNCSFQNCIMYIIIGLAVIVMLVVLVSAVVCICRKKTKAAKRELAPEEIQLNTIRKSDSMEQPNAEVVEITNNMHSTAQPNVENIETSDNLYSTANPFQQTTVICDNVSSLEQPSTADIEISNNVHRVLQPITGTTEISGNVDTTVHPDTGTIYTTDNNENQYNILDHTLLNTRVDNGNGNENAVYDEIKPSVIPTDKFAGSVYDSVALVHKMSDKPKK